MEENLKTILRNWMVKAENDLKSVENEFSSQEPVTDPICFHCQQVAEKYLKAYLVGKNIAPEKTHKIERLIEACSQFDKQFVELKDATLLTQYAVEMRYPDDFYIPSIEEAKDALALAKKVKSKYRGRS